MEAWRNALAKTEQAIAEAEIRLTAQITRIEQLRSNGYDPTLAEQALDQMYGLVCEMHGHRETLLLIGQSQSPVWHSKRLNRRS
jgi:hypothetical protein